VPHIHGEREKAEQLPHAMHPEGQDQTTCDASGGTRSETGSFCREPDVDPCLVVSKMRLSWFGQVSESHVLTKIFMMN